MLQSDQAKGANPQPLARQVEACTADDEADALINPNNQPYAQESKAGYRRDKNKIDDAFGNSFCGPSRNPHSTSLQILVRKH